MKHVFLFLVAILFCGTAYSQKVYCTSAGSADVKVYVVEHEYQADLVVYKAEHSYEVNSNENNGIWFFTEYSYQADKTVGFVDQKYKADITVYFTSHKYSAKWKNESKRHFLY